MEGYQQRGCRRENGGKGTGNKNHNWQVQNRQGEVKNSIRNGEAKELVCMTHGHELSGGNASGMRAAGQKRIKGRKIGTTVIAQIIKYIKNFT